MYLEQLLLFDVDERWAREYKIKQGHHQKTPDVRGGLRSSFVQRIDQPSAQDGA